MLRWCRHQRVQPLLHRTGIVPPTSILENMVCTVFLERMTWKIKTAITIGKYGIQLGIDSIKVKKYRDSHSK